MNVPRARGPGFSGGQARLGGPAEIGGQAGTQPTFLDPRPTSSRQGARLGAGTERSVSNKRQRNGSEGEWQEPAGPRGARKKKDKMPTARGTADFGKFLDLQRPVEIYIGNGNPTINKERIVGFLSENAEKNNVANFKVDEIVTLTKVENPSRRSWKLRVPAPLQEFMLSEACYPVGWEYRKWDFYGPKRQVRGERKEPARGQRMQEQVELVARTGPVVAAVTAAASQAATEHRHNGVEMEQSDW